MATDMAPGAALPSLAALAERFDAAIATVQRAVTILRAEGFVYTRQGAGTFVRDRTTFVVGGDAYFDPRTSDYTYDVLDVRRATPTRDAAELLGLPKDAKAVLRHRLMRHAGEPVELSWSYYPLEIAAGTDLESPHRIRGGAPRVLAEVGFPEMEVVDRLSARLATSEELTGLDLPPDVPVLRTLRVIYSTEDRPVEASVLVQGAHLYELTFRHPVH